MGMKARRKPNKVDALKRHVKKLLKELEGDIFCDESFDWADDAQAGGSSAARGVRRALAAAERVRVALRDLDGKGDRP